MNSSLQRSSQVSIINSSFDGRAARIVVNIDGPDGRFLGEYTVLQKGAQLEVVDENVTPQ
ncbi:MAG: hypothetical protein M3N13_07240 [Candidatus Eremiobacteraeota bacterium]|nr:hypothetical protein [Candidatus Eremiobacteraeota bacterium]